MTHPAGTARRWLARVLFCVGLWSLLGPALAETRDIVAEGTSEACWRRERALDVARVATNNHAHAECRALGPGWRYDRASFAGYSQCERCGTSDEFRCTIKQAVHTCVNLQKEQAEAAEKERAEREAKRQAEREKIAQDKAQAEVRRQEKQDKADRDRADRERRAQEQADRDRIKQRLADGEKAARAAAQKSSGDSGNALDDAFAARQKKSASASSGNVLDDSLQQRSERLAERERQAVLKARTDDATASCQAAAKGVDTCLRSACGAEPAKTHCTDSYWEPGSCDASPGSRCIAIGRTVCRATGPNPAHAQWSACTSAGRAQCEPSGSIDDCVRQRLRAAK